MELWTYINKKTNLIIRCDILDSDPEFGNLYYFVENDYSPYWFVETEDDAILANMKFVHPEFNSYKRPVAESIKV
jgi:hypothetical protein